MGFQGRGISLCLRRVPQTAKHFSVSRILEQCLAERHTRRWLEGHSGRAGWARSASSLPRLWGPGSPPRTQFTRKANSEKFTKHLDFNLLLEMPGYFLFLAEIVAPPLTSQILNPVLLWLDFPLKLKQFNPTNIYWSVPGSVRYGGCCDEYCVRFLSLMASQSDVRGDKQACEPGELAQVGFSCPGSHRQELSFTRRQWTSDSFSFFVFVSSSVKRTFWWHHAVCVYIYRCTYVDAVCIMNYDTYICVCIYTYVCINIYAYTYIYCSLYMYINIDTVYMYAYIIYSQYMHMCYI